MDNLEILYTLGAGSFGQVAAALDPQGREVAVKRMKQYQVKDWVKMGESIVPAEVVCLERLRGVVGIPQLMDYFEVGEHFYIVMERPPDAVDLQQLVAENGALQEKDAKTILRQLLSILWNVREAGLVHRDIKLENVLVNPHTMDTYLIDFGLATPHRQRPFTSFRGTMQYAPPEWLEKEAYFGEEAEVWSLGVTLYGLLTGKNLFTTVAEVLLKNIEVPKGVSRNLKRLLRQMLCRNPLDRVSLDQIMVSDWIKS